MVKLKITKKFISLLTSLTMCFSFANSIIANAINETTELNNVKEVYVEGHKFIVDSNVNDQITVTSEENSSSLIINQNGDAEMCIETIDGEITNYDLIINELNSESVDVGIFQDDVLIEEFDSPEDLIEDNYEGQVAVVGVIITAELILTAVIIAAITIVIVGVVCYAVNEISSQVDKYKGSYFKAYLRLGKVFIDPKTISRSTAISHTRTQGDSGGVYTYYKSDAADVAYSSGYGSTWRGPENHYTLVKHLAGNIYFDHYHNTASGAHIWYGTRKTRSL